MDKLTGMEVAREIRKTDNNVKIVFSTSGNEFASESYEVNARYYLHKPFGIERVKAMLDRIDITGLEKNARRKPAGRFVDTLLRKHRRKRRAALFCTAGKKQRYRLYCKGRYTKRYFCYRNGYFRYIRQFA